MAGETVRGRALGVWSGLRVPSVKASYVAAGFSILFFVLTFLVYHFTGAGPTAYNGPVRLADAILHGRLNIANAQELPFLEWAPYKGKYYVVEPPMTAIVVLPGVALFGLALSQTLVSVVIGSINASSIYRLVRGLTEKLSTQVWLTLLFVFGTVYWWAAANGGVWHFGHTVAVLFLFLAIYETLVAKRPFLAGLFLGAAYLSRMPTVLSLPFFVIMFSDQWLPDGDGKPLLDRINLAPLVKLGAGLGIFVAAGMVYNYLAFETPLPASYHHYFGQWSPTPAVLTDGVFNISHIPRHLPPVFENLPLFKSEAPYVMPGGNGIAFWVTTPAFLYAFFAGLKNKLAIRALVALLIVTLTVLALSSKALPNPFRLDLPYGMEFYPIALLVLSGLFVGLRNKLVLACWLAIIPVALMIFTYAISGGWLSFADRFSLDYYPFVFLLTVRAMGSELKWHHKALIALGIIVNLWGVLWIYQIDPNRFLGLRWAPW